MPELPEVETVVRGLNSMILGEVVKSVDVLREDSVGHPAAKQFAKLLVGHEFGLSQRRGKYIVTSLSKGAHMVVHLRMSGRLVLREEPHTPQKIKKLVENDFLRIRIALESGRELHYEDMRVFGRIWYIPKSDTVGGIVPGIAALGVEPLTDLTVDYLIEAFRSKSQPVKNTLLDQRIIAGIGNIYADESLFLSGINPLLPSGSLKKQQVEVLVGKIIEVLSRSIELGGTTLRDYQNLSGVNGDYQNAAWVYGRAKETCSVCEDIIERVKLAGRSSHYCPTCQPVSKTILRRHETASRALKESKR